MQEQIEKLAQEVREAIKKSESLNDLTNLQIKYLGKKSQLNEILKEMKDLSHEERLKIGQLANDLKNELRATFDKKRSLLEEKQLNQQLEQEKLDLTLPAINLPTGHIHPLQLVINELTHLFQELGYDIVYGTEIETDEFNFQRLNLPPGHPARDMQDTFYLSDNLLLRTHCTNMTAHCISEINDEKGTYAVISTGNTYRRDDDDATHSHQFMQVDGFLIAPGVNFANLKWTIEYFCTRMFGPKTKTRMRPSFFPFTEPSVEVDISCLRCEGKGCNICKNSGWIEIMGAGILNPLVYEACGKSPNLTGLAFGIGIERIAMLKYGVDDIRRFYTNDVRFLQQFSNFN